MMDKIMRKATLIKTIISSLIIICVIIVILVTLKHHSSKKIAEKTTPPTVTVQTFSKKTIPLQVTTYGATVSKNSVIVSSKTLGTIKAIYFQPGDHVTKGERLFKIQSSDTDNQISKLLATTQAKKQAYQSYLQVNQKMPGTVAQIDVDNAKSDYLGALSTYKAAIEETWITAPIEGSISDTDLTIGSNVDVNDPLVTINNLASLEVKYTLPSRYIDQAKPGQTINFNQDDNNYPGVVSYVASALDSNNNITLRAHLSKTKQLTTNMFGQITQILNPDHQALAIPQSLIKTDSGGFYIYIVEDQKIKQQYVDTDNISEQGEVTITQGFSKDMKVIISNTNNLSQGQTVISKDSAS